MRTLDLSGSFVDVTEDVLIGAFSTEAMATVQHCQLLFRELTVADFTHYLRRLLLLLFNSIHCFLGCFRVMELLKASSHQRSQDWIQLLTEFYRHHLLTMSAFEVLFRVGITHHTGNTL